MLLHASVLLFNYNYYTECICILNKSSCTHAHGALSSSHRSLNQELYMQSWLNLIIVLVYYSVLVTATFKRLGTVRVIIIVCQPYCIPYYNMKRLLPLAYAYATCSVGLSLLCQHNFEHNRRVKALGSRIMPACIILIGKNCRSGTIDKICIKCTLHMHDCEIWENLW